MAQTMMFKVTGRGHRLETPGIPWTPLGHVWLTFSECVCAVGGGVYAYKPLAPRRRRRLHHRKTSMTIGKTTGTPESFQSVRF